MNIEEKLNMTMLCDFYELTMGNGYFENGFKDKITAGDLQLLHQIAGSGVKDAVPGFDQSLAYGAQNMGFTGAGIANRDEIAAAVQPVAGSGRQRGLRPGRAEGMARP